MPEVKTFQEATQILPPTLQSVLRSIKHEAQQQAQEIRLIAGSPPQLLTGGTLYFVSNNSELVNCPSGNTSIVSALDLQQLVQNACEYSLYSHQDEIAQGYITIKGGHRVGLSGKYFYSDTAGETMNEFQGVNIRVASHTRPLPKNVQTFLCDSGLDNTLLIGPPGSGKTTLLKSLARHLAGEGSHYYKVGVIDERGEIANCFSGTGQNDIGTGVAVFSYFPKPAAINRCIRTMSPDVIICDEIGSSQDVEALKRCAVSGVCVIATAHGSSIKDLRRNPALRTLLDELFFTRFLVLEPGFRVTTHNTEEGTPCSKLSGVV